MHSDITGILLAGGASSRMGTNKALMKLGNETAIERASKILSSVFSKVLLSTNSQEFSFLELPVIKDIYKDIGPLSGIHSGLVHSETDKIFVLSCDMPLMTIDQVEYIISYPAKEGARQIVVAKADGFIQQLCGIYSKSLLPSIDELYKSFLNSDTVQKGCKVLQLVKNSESTIIDVKNEFPEYKEDTFFNMNRPEDFELIKKLFV